MKIWGANIRSRNIQMHISRTVCFVTMGGTLRLYLLDFLLPSLYTLDLIHADIVYFMSHEVAPLWPLWRAHNNFKIEWLPILVNYLLYDRTFACMTGLHVGPYISVSVNLNLSDRSVKCLLRGFLYVFTGHR